VPKSETYQKGAAIRREAMIVAGRVFEELRAEEG